MSIREWFTKRHERTVLNSAFRKLSIIADVDKAISFRTLGQYDEAINLLKNVLKDFPEYTPAMSVLGGTLRVAGRIEEAERLLKQSIELYGRDSTSMQGSPLIEWYATLGDIYQFDRKNGADTALSYYKHALACKKPKHLTMTQWEVGRSVVFMQLGNLLLEYRRWEEAKSCAEKRLAVDPNCPIGRKVFVLAFIGDFTLSKSVSHESECANCDHKQMFLTWESINARLNPELKEKLLIAFRTSNVTTMSIYDA